MTAPTEPLTHAAAFERFDSLDDAVTNIEGTLAIMTALIDHGCSALNADITVALERHLKRDLLDLASVCVATREAILAPLAAAAPAGDDGDEQ